jgi:N-acetyltransferase
MLTDVTLTGAHVRLEPLSPAHVPALVEVGLDPSLWTISLTRLETPDDVRRYVEAALRERAAGQSLPFAIVHAPSGRVVGSTRFGNVDLTNRHVEIGWTWVAPAWQRTAVNTEAKYLMLRHAFETLGCMRVELKTDVLNARSRAAILRLGAKEEGVFRKHMLAHGGRVRDTIWFSVIDDEWPGVKARLEARLEPRIEARLASEARAVL